MSTNGFVPEKWIEIDDWADETEVKPGTLRNELNYRNKALEEFGTLLLGKQLPVEPLLLLTGLEDRPYEVLYQKFGDHPESIFMFSVEGRRVVGKKYMSDLCLTHGIPVTFLFSSLVTAPMILGLVDRDQVTQDGVLVFFKPFTPAEKLAAFVQLTRNKEVDLYYPFAQLLTSKKLEQTTPEQGWVYSPERGKVMELSEVEQRNLTVRLMPSLLKDIGSRNETGARAELYDPACSSGGFLAHVQRAYPDLVRTTGQDLSESMVAESKGKLDVVHLGDSLHSPVQDESMDVVFFRFLNADVVTTEQAHDLFFSLVKKCRVHGFIIVLGYTPVLVSKAVMTKAGLRLLQAVGVTEDAQAVFQYYVLQKEQPTPSLGYAQVTANIRLYA